MKKLPSIALVAIFIVTIILAGMFYFGPSEEVPLSTQGTTDCPIYADALMYWIYAVVAIGVVALIIFAIAQLIRMFKTDAKGALGSLGAFALFFILLGVCYAISGGQEYHKVVNGSEVFYDATTIKMVDMWIYSIYALLSITVLLVLGFGVKKLITK